MKYIKIIGVIMFLAVLVLGYFYYLANYKNVPVAEEVKETTVVQEMIMEDLTARYPPTPKEVIRVYAEITQILHNETYTEEELAALAGQLQKLFDDDLLAINSSAQYLERLQADIQVMKANSYRISNFMVSASTDVEFYTHDNYECARLHCFFYISAGDRVVPPSDHLFVLRKDDAGHWKILGWEYVAEETGEEAPPVSNVGQTDE